ncbi:hypothetical protein GCM10023311_01070 [Flaviramulus aquimarinus]|uniref:Uncharacterized protein n=1 Tax=Flaviramulus aquimarinus TaxID=1170456 RepID=A0ABP9EN20_9FLAO
MEITLSKNKYISHFVGFIFIIMALSDILHSRSFMLAGALLSIMTFVFYFSMKNKNYLSEAIFFILFLLITSLINLFFTQNNFGGSVTLLGNLFLSFIYFQIDNKKTTIWIIASYLITIIFISYKLFVLEIHPNLLYEGLSRNHAGFAVVFYTIFLLFHLKVTYNRFPILPPLIGVVLAFFLFGRTSLIVTFILLLVVLFYKFKSNHKARIVAIFLFLGLCYYLWLKYGSLLSTETNLGEGLDTPRWELWRIYIESINFINIFTGVDVTELRMYDQFGGNPHNSFIKFHSRVGIGSFAFITLFFLSIFKYLKTKQYYIFWLLILLTIRAFFDSDIFIGNFDFIFFIITFYWIKTD